MTAPCPIDALITAIETGLWALKHARDSQTPANVAYKLMAVRSFAEDIRNAANGVLEAETAAFRALIDATAPAVEVDAGDVSGDETHETVEDEAPNDEPVETQEEPDDAVEP